MSFNTNTFQVQDSDAILQSFLNGTVNTTPQIETSTESQTDIEKLLNQETKPTDAAIPQGNAVSNEDVEKLLSGKTEEVKEEENQFFKTPEDLYGALVENEIAFLLEDGSKPKTTEELINALKQSVDYKTNTSIEQAWKEKVESLPENLLRIHQYASQGVTTATELQQFMSAVSQSEAIGQLDPKVPEHQEKIVLLQLLNSGTPEETANTIVETLKEKGTLEKTANDSYPALRKTYDDNIRLKEIAQQEKVDREQEFFNINATNVQYFLDEKNQDYLPFKVTANKDKQVIYDLAASVAEVTPEGEPVYAWEKKLKELQFGDEKAYKKFMKFMTVLALDDKYDEKVTTKGSNKATEKTFKSIMTTQGTRVNQTSTEPVKNITIPSQRTPTKATFQVR